MARTSSIARRYASRLTCQWPACHGCSATSKPAPWHRASMNLRIHQCGQTRSPSASLSNILLANGNPGWNEDIVSIHVDRRLSTTSSCSRRSLGPDLLIPAVPRYPGCTSCEPGNEHKETRNHLVQGYSSVSHLHVEAPSNVAARSGSGHERDPFSGSIRASGLRQCAPPRRETIGAGRSSL